jgi:hypothetical protein
MYMLRVQIGGSAIALAAVVRIKAHRNREAGSQLVIRNCLCLPFFVLHLLTLVWEA